MGLSSSKSDRTFKPSKAKGGCELDAQKTALVLIEYQFLAGASETMTRNARSSAAHALRERTARARVGYAFFLTARPFFPRRDPSPSLDSAARELTPGLLD